LDRIIDLATDAHVDYFLLGGSLVINDAFDQIIDRIKVKCNIPCVLFPGSAYQAHHKADAILLLSLISGRNPDLLIGQHVHAAPMLKKSGMEIISTGYMIIDGGVETSVSYISNSKPIPANKSDIAVCTAMAGEMLGMKIIYMDAGSGAKRAIPEQMISKVATTVDIPIIVGGGIRNAEQASKSINAGADMVIVGNAIEKDTSIIMDISAAVHAFNRLPIT
jgi:putative glycerol-1-phosphate prenyltransferase